MRKSQPVHYTNTQFNHNFDLEDWNIDALFKDSILAEFIDESDGNKTSRGGIVIPETARSMKDFYRIAVVLKAGPECSESITEGCFLLVPPQLGLMGIKKGPSGGKSVFLREEIVLAVISPKDEEAVTRKKEEF